MKSFAAMVVSTALSLSALAHEGHDKTPGAMAAPHGGLVQGAGKLDLELVTRPDGVAIYVYGAEMKPIALDKVKVDGTVAFPRGKKTQAVSFTAEGDALVAKIDAKGAHRYTLELTVTNEGKTSKTKFNVEPQ